MLKDDKYDGFKTKVARIKRALIQRNLELRIIPLTRHNYHDPSTKYEIWRSNPRICENSSMDIEGVERWIREADLSGIIV